MKTLYLVSDAMYCDKLILLTMLGAACSVQVLPGREGKEDDIGRTGHPRWKREGEEEVETTTEDFGTGPPVESGEAVGPSLGQVLSKFCYVVMIAYILGIGWKLIKIYRGEYEPEEPIYLKYK